MSKIRVMIADDLEEMVSYFTSELEAFEDIELTRSASSGEEAIALTPELSPDVILMDIQMESDDAGITASRKILELYPSVKIIALTIHENSDLICKAFDAGIVDYVLKSASINELITVIRDCVTSDEYKKINSILASDLKSLKINQRKLMMCVVTLNKISKTETVILRSLCKGMSYREISSALFQEETSIRASVAKITKKTQVRYIKDLIRQFNDCHFFDIYDSFS